MYTHVYIYIYIFLDGYTDRFHAPVSNTRSQSEDNKADGHHRQEHRDEQIIQRVSSDECGVLHEVNAIAAWGYVVH